MRLTEQGGLNVPSNEWLTVKVPLAAAHIFLQTSRLKAMVEPSLLCHTNLLNHQICPQVPVSDFFSF